jgi:hypothetical protein
MSAVKGRLVAVLVAVVSVSCVVGVSPGFALGGLSSRTTPWWSVSTIARPGYLKPGGEGTIVVTAENLGDTAVFSESLPVTITDTLPEGFVATAVSASAGSNTPRESTDGEPTCQLSPVLSCSWSGEAGTKKTLQPYEPIEMYIKVKAPPAAMVGVNRISVAGGEVWHCERLEAGREFGHYKTPACDPHPEGRGASESNEGGYEAYPAGRVPGVTSDRKIVVSSAQTPFGISEYFFGLENEEGLPERQAGGHPFQYTTTLAFNEGAETLEPPAPPRNIRVDLPSGLVGNATIIPQCTETQFSHIVGENANECPPATVVGVAQVKLTYRIAIGGGETPPTPFVVPVFNMVPSPGEPARFAFEAEEVPVTIDTAVRTGRDYGIVANVTNTTTGASLLSSVVSLWGVPGDPRHDSARGWPCVSAGHYETPHLCEGTTDGDPIPLLTLPTSCTGENLQTSVQATGWPQSPGGERAVSGPPLNQAPVPGMVGCGRLPFEASIAVAPDVQEASKPTGLNVHIHVPQEGSLDAGGVAGADVRDTTVTLPEGVTLNPSGADGLQACSDSEIGFEGVESPSETSLFSASIGASFCPSASKVGAVKIKTPLLAHELEGSVYLASQDENPFGSLVAMYLVAEDPVSGVLVKLPGEVSLNAVTGQITSTFKNTPQVPFEDLELHFYGGERAPLSTPARCGNYTTTAAFTPWSGNEPISASTTFTIDSGPNGTPCPGAALPFAPSLTGGTTSIQAGGFSPFTTTITREDGQQSIQSVQLHMPPGLSGVLTGVPLCGEAQANAGTCGAASRIGSTIVSVGLGGDPYSVTGGEVFLTEKIAGSPADAPFGLSVVNPAVAGPFNLGKVVVRAQIAIDPQTAQLTITTDASGPYKIPTILDGIPLQIKHVNVTIERAGFTFNPTDCDPRAITGTVNSAEGSSAPVSVPFQVTNCAALKFTPKFSAATPGRTSRAGGAGLSVKLSYPGAPLGTQANIRSVKVELPKQLPSRLKPTLQNACLARVFEANPAGCPVDSLVGTARATTPILPVPLEGPAYFVSHGGEAFPSLVVVLQGYGVTVDLLGTTYIDGKTNITSSTFKTVPDVPVGTFELTLPEGPHSALATNLPEKDHESLCTQKLTMPTTFVAQDGQELHQNTKITPTGCTKAKKTRAKHKKTKKHKHTTPKKKG